MTRYRWFIPSSVVVNDRIHRDEQNLKFWSGVFRDALALRDRRRAERRVR